MLKESLIKYKDSKAEKKEKLKRNIAQALKFLRKLGRKLRKPVFRKVPTTGFNKFTNLTNSHL